MWSTSRKLTNGTTLWIIFLVILLIALNILMFTVYVNAHPNGDFAEQIWAYCASEIFKVITASLVLPILLFLLESRFKIADTIVKNRLEREHRDEENVKARRHKEEMERREERLMCITRTIQMWNHLDSLVSEVRYFRKDLKRAKDIEDLLIRIDNFPSAAEDVINMWFYCFPNLSIQDTHPFIVFINTVLSSTGTVAQFIAQTDNTDEIAMLQDSLDVIFGVMKTITHHPMISSFKYSMELLQLEERKSSSGRKQVESNLKQIIDNARNWAEELMRYYRQNEKVLAPITGNKVETFRKKYEELEAWAREHPGQNLNESKEFVTFRRLFYKIPIEKRISAKRWPYSTEYIRTLSDYLSFESIAQGLLSRAAWPK